jgi:hypothetical protein
MPRDCWVDDEWVVLSAWEFMRPGNGNPNFSFQHEATMNIKCTQPFQFWYYKITIGVLSNLPISRYRPATLCDNREQDTADPFVGIKIHHTFKHILNVATDYPIGYSSAISPGWADSRQIQISLRLLLLHHYLVATTPTTPVQSPQSVLSVLGTRW